MAVFPQSSVNYLGRTNTQLVVSEGNAPAEKYLPNPSEVVKFQYTFGPQYNQNVVIPKGKIVKASGLVYDIETEKHIPSLAIATDADAALGVNHHNVYETKRDIASGNAPTVLTREYIRVPLFANATAATARDFANAIKFGAAWTTDVDTLFGKYVCSDLNGNFRVWDKANDDTDAIIGQVYGVEKDMPPAGFLQYFMEMTDNEYTNLIKNTQIVPSPGRTKSKAGTLDIATFPSGVGYYKNKETLWKLLNNFTAGIPFLTDGYFKARTTKTIELGDTTNIASVKIMGNVTVADSDAKLYGNNDNTEVRSVVTLTDYVGSALFIRLNDKLAKDALGKDYNGNQLDANNLPEFGGTTPSAVKVYTQTKAGASKTQISANNVHVDYENNVIVVYFTEAVSAKNIVVEAVVLENQVPGIPTGWDAKGNMGEARILLMK